MNQKEIFDDIVVHNLRSKEEIHDSDYESEDWRL